MEINFKSEWCGATLSIKADNVNIEEHVSNTIYGVTPNGEKDFKNRIGKEIDPEILNKICSVLEDMVYYTDSEYDSTRLIEYLFEKLPQDKLSDLMVKLNKEYIFEDSN